MAQGQIVQERGNEKTGGGVHGLIHVFAELAFSDSA
jgi:hypothetical protein